MEVIFPVVFSSILSIEDKQGNFGVITSLDIEKNINSIKKLSQAEGGSGGSFFLFSNDNALILKSMLDEDYATFQSLNFAYYTHIRDYHNNSILSYILGIYSFTFKNTNENIFLMSMRNLSGTLKNHIKYIYDIKGSVYKR